ncbi:MAG: DAK2 domain-containing protein [Bacilli bacterium]|nr:DAK2 domain-containing protein [Bacilli bacterium]
MDSLTLDGALFNQLLNYAYQDLAAHYEAINDLNVFPVPDGDTGTNMKMTFNNGLKNIKESENIGDIADNLARGMLFGARGNSGVLTSQYFKGLADGLKGKKEVTVSEFAEAMVQGYKTAYSATVDPTEGTILTVAREGIENVKKSIVSGKTTFAQLFAMVVDAMKISLDNTPNLLPVLKESGVIDSGGKGLLTIFEGILKYLNGEEITGYDEEDTHSLPTSSVDFSAFNENSVLDYGYCTEFLLQLLTSKIDVEKFDIQSFIAYLQEHGNSIVCFQTGTIVKVHIHTKKPYEVIEFAQRYGEFVAFKMENMALQHNEVLHKEEEKAKVRKNVSIISIAQGDGIIELFKELGSDIVLNGGTTMNTSTAEMIDAFKFANSDEIILLPNETNIIMAAKQAAELFKGSRVRVIETKTIPEGYNALSMLMGGDESADDAYNDMLEASQAVISCFVTKASRDTTLNGVKVKKGYYIESVDGKLVGCNENREEAILEMLSKVEDIENREVMFAFYGQMVSEEDAEHAISRVNEAFPQLETGLIEGKQDVYDFLIGIN